MSMPKILVVMAAIASLQPPRVTHFIPTSELVRVASMAARDEGRNPDAEGAYLQELHGPDGRGLFPGYNSIALYENGHSVRSYSIRIDTGDVVDGDRCVILRFPDLVEFKNTLMKDFGSKGVSLADIADEVGCERLTIVSERK